MTVASRRQLGRVAAGAVVVALATGATAGAQPAAPSASAASTLMLNERAQLHRTSSHGFTLNEEGSVTGTIKGVIYIHLNVSSQSSVTAEVSIYPSNGSLTGYGTASYQVSGAYASFSGTMSIARGTGRYAHAHATGLRFTGTIKRVDDATTVGVVGKLSY